MDFTECLQPELVDMILSYFTDKELCTFSECCVQWREISNKDHLWYRYKNNVDMCHGVLFWMSRNDKCRCTLFMQHFNIHRLHHCMAKGWLRYGLDGDILTENHLNISMTNVAGNSPVFKLFVSEGSRLSPLCKWKNIYIRVHHLHKNWRKGRYSVSPLLKGHTEKVTAMACNGKFVVSGSEDKTLRLWDISQATCVRKLDGHMDTITKIIWKGNTIITGCEDSSLRVIDSNDFRILFSLQGHSGSVDHMTLVGKVLVTAATDRTIRLWYLPDRKLIHIMRGHEQEVECMCSFGNHVVTGSWDHTLALWDVEHAELVHMYEGHTEVVTCCWYNGERIVSGSADGDLRIWRPSPPKCLHVLQGHEADVYCLAANTSVIASGSSDSTVRVWGFDGKCRYTLNGHLGVVRCLHLCEERLVSGGDQKKVIVWDYKTGEQMNIVHRHPSLLHLMWANETKLITASPERPGTIAVLSYW
ncbi:F-box/WD repeat-containing protein 7-like isoform X1 [Dreissena polymorpha]|uniref:F-box/WD repeat-containing protein 7-like isoform X1 n=1 Tax=Dreissena polymorpha TaxID=45954 RepID=UPI00226422B2|nr:F-box/WD repeat-containing protein 7-like isoform X1 [Dreissena polymorpha]XP_052269310.1 F-box/WD repeat-containing protein 7-like isoform X1 [Dreissena polymorpha]XP_052269311.1 F-box/WD repeat-containing protein 7-like isoform X1 [Dreissena polymorpha]XP_052269312.1 F-box/WD repeat-containing protein 7-like isoform X1 [Dreissena polymorpha]